MREPKRGENIEWHFNPYGHRHPGTFQDCKTVTCRRARRMLEEARDKERSK